MKMRIYQHDADGIYTGNYQDRDEAFGIPYRWSDAILPRLRPGQSARLNGNSWLVFDTTSSPFAIVPVPAKVTRSQARRALLLRGLLDEVQPALDTIPDGTQRRLAQIEWDDALDFERSNALVLMIGVALGLDDAGLDDLFIFAASLP